MNRSLVAVGLMLFAGALFAQVDVSYGTIILAVEGTNIDARSNDDDAEFAWHTQAADELIRSGHPAGAVLFVGTDNSQCAYRRESSMAVPELYATCRSPCDSTDDESYLEDSGGGGDGGGYSGGYGGGTEDPFEQCFVEHYSSCSAGFGCQYSSELVCPGGP